MTGPAYLCQFTTLDDVKRKDEGSAEIVLEALSRQREFSVFDATRTPKMAKTMDYIVAQGWINRVGDAPYPWQEFVLTDKGRAVLAGTRGKRSK
jgi:hypothetical protein